MDTRTQAVFQTIVNQRNQAMDTVANLVGEIEALKEKSENTSAHSVAYWSGYLLPSARKTPTVKISDMKDEFF